MKSSGISRNRYDNALQRPGLGLTAIQQSSGNKKAEEDANKDAEEQMKEITKAGEKGGDKVVDDVLNAVISVNPEVPNKIA